MTDGVIMSDMDYRVLVANPAARKAAGLENKNNLSLLDFAAGLSGKIDLRDKIEGSIRLDNIFVSDEVLLADRFFKIAISPVKDGERTLGCVVVFRDMTHEKEVQQIKDDFTSMIVHELRSPLDSIKKMIELMRSSVMKKARSIECLQMIYGSSSDMLELVNNLLDVAKIEAGKFTLAKQPSDIKVIIKERIMFFDVAAKDAKVIMESKFGKDVPNAVRFDPHTVSQVLNNLLSNALKFNKENGSIEVQVLLHRKEESLEKEAKDAGINWFIKNDIPDIPDSLFVAVTNTGAGIAKDQINKLFNKFFQVKTVFAKKGGTGLGLAITKSIVESHGGIVGAESTEGEGATFYFTLPVNEPDETAGAETGVEVPIKR
jgi:signal transduction histidine kinase